VLLLFFVASRRPRRHLLPPEQMLCCRGRGLLQWRGMSTRMWTVDGAITAARRSNYFYTDVKEQNKELLLPSIEKGSHVMLHAPRASGKSTRMEAAIEQLEETGKYTLLKTSLQSGVEFEGKERFWATFGAALRRDNGGAAVPLIRSA